MTTPSKVMAKVVSCLAGQTDRVDRAGRMPSARLIYTASDPWAVTLELTNANGQMVAWRVSRDLLRLGATCPPAAPAGEGDVRVCVDLHDVRVALSSDTGSVVLWFPAAAVREFLAVTFFEVPAGTEADHVDWNTLINALRSGEW